MSKAASQDEGSADHQSRPILLGSLLILCLVGAAFYPVWQGGLVYDDCEVWGPEAVDQLGFVREGISISGMSEALRCRYGNNWQPVSWWSHMLDASLFGAENVRAGHGVNLLVHGVNACLVFLLYGIWCDRAGGGQRVAGWLLCMVALGWALHPLRVESVAWLIERKDVLSAFFVLLGLWCFDRFRREDPGRQRGLWLALLTLSYALALGAKASALSFPGLLLLLDLFIYRRDPRGADGGLKSFAYLVPVIALTLAYLVVNLGATATVEVPLTMRIQHALGSLPAYAAKIFWPVDLSYFYPYPQQVEVWRWGGGLLLLGGAVWLAWRAWPSGNGNSNGARPWLAVGLLWFLAAIVPMLGLVQVGDQGMADRYTYLPSVGLSLLVIGLFELAGRKARWVWAAAAAVVLVLFVFLTRQQSKVWHDEETLYSHALRVDPENYHATYNLGVYLLANGQQERGQALLQQALSFPQVEASAADVLAKLAKQRGEAELAEQYWRRSLQRKPHGTQALQALAWHYYDAGRLEEAETLFRRATQVPASSVEIPRHTAYAVFLYSQKRYAEARAQMEAALRRNPRDGHARKLQELLDQS